MMPEKNVDVRERLLLVRRVLVDNEQAKYFLVQLHVTSEPYLLTTIPDGSETDG
ncbi:MAG: hypothetical protein WA323_03910 [Candidatus Nitrosopolaris sp.]